MRIRAASRRSGTSSCRIASALTRTWSGTSTGSFATLPLSPAATRSLWIGAMYIYIYIYTYICRSLWIGARVAPIHRLLQMYVHIYMYIYIAPIHRLLVPRFVEPRRPTRSLWIGAMYTYIYIYTYICRSLWIGVTRFNDSDDHCHFR